MSRQHRTLRAEGLNPHLFFPKKVSRPHFTMKDLRVLAKLRQENTRLRRYNKLREKFIAEHKSGLPTPVRKLSIFQRFIAFIKNAFKRS
jgi:hypothetical protein